MSALHTWGVYKRKPGEAYSALGIFGRYLAYTPDKWVLVSHHKTHGAALKYARSGEQIRRTSEKGHGWASQSARRRA